MQAQRYAPPSFQRLIASYRHLNSVNRWHPVISLLPGVWRRFATPQGALDIQQRRLWERGQTGAKKGVIQDALASKSDATIFALSSGSGRAAIAVIRVSGSACVEVRKP